MGSVRAAVLKWQGSCPAAWALRNSGGFWCPLVLGTQKRPAASLEVPLSGASVLSAPGLRITRCRCPRRSPFALPDAEGDQPVGYRDGCGGTWRRRRACLLQHVAARWAVGARSRGCWLPQKRTSDRCALRKRWRPTGKPLGVVGVGV